MPTWDDMKTIYDRMKGRQLFRIWDDGDIAGRIMTILVLARARRREGKSSAFRNVLMYYADWKHIDFQELEDDIRTHVRKCGYADAFGMLEGMIE